MIRRILAAVMVLALVSVTAGAADENPIVTLVKSKVKDPTKPFAMAIVFKVKPSDAKAFEAAFPPALAATRKEPGCVAYVLHRDPEAEGTFVMYEQFRSIAALEAHAKQPYVEKLLGTVLPLLEGKPDVKVYTVAGE